MEALIEYLNNLFHGVKETPEVLRAKAELLQMMEDKYEELLADGKNEEEAVGIVISEFGNFVEYACEVEGHQPGACIAFLHSNRASGINQEDGSFSLLFCHMANNLCAFSVVFSATSSMLQPLISAILAAISGMLALSFRVPRRGVGARYGASVSRSIRSSGISFTVSGSLEFLNVTTPPMPTDQSPHF